MADSTDTPLVSKSAEETSGLDEAKQPLLDSKLPHPTPFPPVDLKKQQELQSMGGGGSHPSVEDPPLPGRGRQDKGHATSGGGGANSEKPRGWASPPSRKAEDAEDEEALASALFNWGERPVQDALFGRIFLAGVALLVLREVFVFFWPVLGLRFFDPETFTVEPFFSVLLGCAIAVPCCFVFLWAFRGATSQLVQVTLVLCLAAFMLAFCFHAASPPPTAGTEEPEDGHMSWDHEQGPHDHGSRPSFPSSQSVGALGDESESTMLEAAIPTSISRILLAADTFAGRSDSHEIRMHPAGAVARRMLHFAAGVFETASTRSGIGKHPAGVVARRMLRFAAAAASKWAPHRRGLHVDLAQRGRLLQAESVLDDLVNAGAVLMLLCYCWRLFGLTALVIRDSAKFVLTRGRGLVFAPIALVTGGVVVSLPAIAIGLQVAKACEAEHSSEQTLASQQQQQLCSTWKDAALADPLQGSVFTALGIFLAVWGLKQVQNTLQFMAAHVVGQCYGNSRVSMDEDDIHAVWRATKCAFNESFGTLSLLSLVSAAALSASILLNLAIMFLLGDSVFSALPLVVNSLLLFAFSIFLECFVLPMVALKGQSFADATYASLSLVQRNLLPAVAFTLTTLCVVGVVVFLVLAGGTILAILGALMFAALGSVAGFMFFLWLMLLFAMVFVTSTAAVTLFHWIFSTTISSTFLCLLLEGKADESTTSTPLGLEG